MTEKKEVTTIKTISLAISGVLITGVIATTTVLLSDSKCDDINLDLGSEELCVTELQYQDIKEALVSELESPKGYDFDYSSAPLLGAVLNQEIQGRGVTIDKNVDADRIREELILLLQSP